MAAKKKPQPEYLTQPAPEFDWDAGDQFLTSVTAAEPKKSEPSSLLRRAGDYGISAVKGAIGVPEAVVGMADLVSGGYAGKAAESLGFRPAEARAMLDEMYSPEQKAAFQAVQDAGQGQDFLPRVAAKGMAALQNPSTIAQSITESLPVMGMGGLIGRGAMAVAPRLGAVGAAALGEGSVTAGQQAEQVRQQTPDGLLTAQQAALAGGSGAVTGLLSLGGGALAKRLGIGDVDTLIASGGLATKDAQKGFVRKAMEGAVSEGLLEELPQSVQEQVATNLALGKPLDEGVDEAAVMGFLSGGAMGAGAANMGRPGDAIRAQKTGGGGPLSKAVDAGIETQAQAADMLALPAPTISVDASGRATTADQRMAAREDTGGIIETGAVGLGRNSEPGLASPEENQAAAEANIAKFAAQRPGMPLGRVLAMQNVAQERGMDLTPILHPDGNGYMLMPSQFLTEDMRAAAAQEVAQRTGRIQDVIDQPAGLVRQKSGDGVEIDPVQAYINTRAAEGTPAARAFTQDVQAGRITRDDIAELMRRRPETADDRLERAAAQTLPQDELTNRLVRAAQQAPKPMQGDILAANGLPFKNQTAAKMAAKKQGGTVVQLAPTEFIVRPEAVDATQPATQPDVRSPEGDGQPGTPDAGRGNGDQLLRDGKPAGLGDGAGVPVGQDLPGPGAAGVRPALDPAPAAELNDQAATVKKGAPQGDIAAKPADQAGGVPAAGAASTLEAAGVAGAPINKEWTAFAPESGTLNIPRAEMPQVKAEHRGALVQFLKARDVAHEQDAEVDPATLKPTQAEFSPEKVQKAKEFTGGDRSILVSSDGHVVDGHHQWLDKLQAGEPVKVIRLDAPVAKLLPMMREFPSAEQADGAPAVSAPVSPPTPAAAQAIEAAETAPERTYKSKGAATIQARRVGGEAVEAGPGLWSVKSATPLVQQPTSTAAPSIQKPEAAIDAFNSDDVAGAMAVVSKLKIDDLKRVGEAIGFVPQVNETAKAYRERLGKVADRLTKTARERAHRERNLYDKLMGRAMDYDRAADHAARARQNGVADDSTAHETSYNPMDGSGSQWMRIPQALDKLAADVQSMRSDPEFEKVAAMVREKRPRVFEHKAAPVSAKTPATARAPAQISDFGEKLDGARKDYAAKLKDAMDVDVAAEPLSKSWPEPDYQKLLDGGADKFTVSFVHAMRDEVPTKPSSAWKLKGWVKNVTILRDVSSQILSGEITAETLRTTLERPEFANMALEIGGRAELYREIGHAQSLKGVTIMERYFSLYRGQEKVSKWVIEQRAKATAFSNWPRELAAADTKEQAIQEFKDKIGSINLGSKAKGQPQFEIYRRRGQPDYIIGKKIGREQIDLHKVATIKEARAYMAEHAADLEAKLAKYKETPFERNTQNQPRVGDDHRNGAPVTPEVFADTFGFRGVQFGNYVEQGRRQSDLNEAFDGLMDLAAVLGVPPRALSLNGRLGLAFGARGKGGKNAPAAHFEPASQVINLTKGGGPGSLAHEWWHAVDNYFARLSVEKTTDFVTDGAVVDRLREQMRQAFGLVKRATTAPTLRARSEELDKRRTKPYWNTPLELSARSFESYVVAKLKDQSAANDYLANIVDPAVWQATEDMRREILGKESPAPSYPYPSVDELPNVRAAFDEFFRTVQTRQDADGNVAMFSRGAKDQASSRVQEDVTAITKNWANAPEVVVAFDMQDEAIPEAVRKADQQQRSQGAAGDPEGFYYGGKVYLLSSQIKTQRDTVRVLFHEALGHYGLRGTYGSGLAKILDEIAQRRRADVHMKAISYGLSINDPAQARMAAEEYLAQLAEGGTRIGWVRRAVAAIRGFLRKAGLRLQLSDDELIRDYLLPARKWVEQGAGKAAGGVAFQRVFHGTPYRGIEQFSTDKIGTGEGAHMYGWGLYFAGKREVAEHYRQQLSASMRGWNYAEQAKALGIDNYEAFRSEFHAHANGHAPTGMATKRIQNMSAVARQVDSMALSKLVEAFRRENNGQLYEAEIPEDDSYLLWDKPLSEQPQAAQTSMRLLVSGIEKEWLRSYEESTNQDVPDMTGGDLYKMVQFAITADALHPNVGSDAEQAMLDGRTDKAASLLMAEDGVKGIKYLDGNSRSAGDGSYNYVLFDGADAKIERTYFSRSVTGATRGLDADKIRSIIADLSGKAAGARVSLWDRTIGTQYAKAEKYAQSPATAGFKTVFDRLQQYNEDTSTLANEAADQAGDILPKLEHLSDLANTGLSKADTEALSGPVFEGTLNWTRDEDGKPVETGDIGSAGIVWTPEELKSRFGLNDKQVQHYMQFRKSVDVSLDQAVAADVLRLAGPDFADLRPLAKDDREKLRRDLIARLQDRVSQATGRAKDQAAALLDDVLAKYERIDDLKARGYAPLMRFGRYKVNIVKSGETVFFGLYETPREANAAARALQEDPQFKGATFERGMLSEEAFRLMSQVPIESLEMFADALGAEQAEVFKEYIRLTKNNRSALKRMLTRKGTAGFSQDARRVLASFVVSNARVASQIMHMGDARKAAETIRAGDVQDEAVKLIESVQNPVDTMPAARGLLFTHFIGGSIASALVNVTQPVTMTLPYLSQWGGMAKASARLVSAAKVAAQVVAGGKVADKDLAAALKKAEDDGIVRPQEIHHLMAEASGSLGKNDALRKLAFVWGMPFSLAEQFNRQASFIAAWQTAKAEGIADPFAFAEKAVKETQGIYNAGNRANWARNPVGAVVLTFKQFSTHYLEWLGRMYNSGPEGKKAAAWAIAILVLAAGADGIPFAGDLDDAVDTLGQALGYDFSLKRARHDFARSVLGDTLGDVATRGLSSLPGVPFDVSARMGMADLIPASGLFLKSTKDATSEVAQLGGAAGSLLTQYRDAGKALLSGDVPGAVQGALPVALKNAIAGVMMAANGEARDTKGRRVMATDGLDAAMKGLGLQPQKLAGESYKMGLIRRGEDLAKAVEGEIVDQWTHGLRDQDTGAVKAARERLADWNAKNPQAPIVIKPQQIRQRLRNLSNNRSDRFIRTVAPERRALARAAMEEAGAEE